MEKIYEEMKERLKFLQTQEETEEIKWRISELKISILAVQQMILKQKETESINNSLKFPTKEEIIQVLYKCAKIDKTDEGIKIERLFEEEAKAVLKLFGGNNV